MGGFLKNRLKKGKEFAAESPNIGTAILRRLGDYSRMYQSYLNDKNSDDLMFFAYVFL